MEQTLLIYNTLHRQKERFEPLHAPNVASGYHLRYSLPLSEASWL